MSQTVFNHKLFTIENGNHGGDDDDDDDNVYVNNKIIIIRVDKVG